MAHLAGAHFQVKKARVNTEEGDLLSTGSLTNGGGKFQIGSSISERHMSVKSYLHSTRASETWYLEIRLSSLEGFA